MWFSGNSFYYFFVPIFLHSLMAFLIYFMASIHYIARMAMLFALHACRSGHVQWTVNSKRRFRSVIKHIGKPIVSDRAMTNNILKIGFKQSIDVVNDTNIQRKSTSFLQKQMISHYVSKPNNAQNMWSHSRLNVQRNNVACFRF